MYDERHGDCIREFVATTFRHTHTLSLSGSTLSSNILDGATPSIALGAELTCFIIILIGMVMRRTARASPLAMAFFEDMNCEDTLLVRREAA